MPTTSLESNKNLIFGRNTSSLVKRKLKRLCKKDLKKKKKKKKKKSSTALSQFLTKIEVFSTVEALLFRTKKYCNECDFNFEVTRTFFGFNQ